jgi:hypothetical protein
MTYVLRGSVGFGTTVVLVTYWLGQLNSLEKGTVVLSLNSLHYIHCLKRSFDVVVTLNK